MLIIQKSCKDHHMVENSIMTVQKAKYYTSNSNIGNKVKNESKYAMIH